MEKQSSMAERLGMAPETRGLIINADDFGMCHDENEGAIEGLTHGIFTSATILVTCPWFEEAADFSREHPESDLGVHLTLTSEWPCYKWGPVLGARAVPSLVDERGYLWPAVPQVYSHDRLEEVEAELRAQIEKARRAGIDVTHLDSHMGPLHLREDYHAIYLRLAREYRLPIRLTGRSVLERMGFRETIEGIEREGILHPDHFIPNGPGSPAETESHWTRVIRALRPGITEIFCHPAYARAELRGCAHDAAQREADLAFFTSHAARRLVEDEGIRLVGYRELRAAMRGDAGTTASLPS